jgi:L-lactate utilization protein LutC
MFHQASTEASEENNAEGDEVIVIAANGIASRCWVVVGQGEELERMRSGLWDEHVGEEDESYKIEG